MVQSATDKILCLMQYLQKQSNCKTIVGIIVFCRYFISVSQVLKLIGINLVVLIYTVVALRLTNFDEFAPNKHVYKVRRTYPLSVNCETWMQQWAPNSLQFLDPHNIDEMHVYASQCKIPSYPADSGQEIQSLQYKAAVIPPWCYIFSQGYTLHFFLFFARLWLFGGCGFGVGVLDWVFGVGLFS